MSSVFGPIHSKILDYYSTQLKKTPELKLVLNKKVTLEFVLEQKPDAVIVAVGGSPRKLEVPGADGRNVVNAYDLSNYPFGQRMAVVGGGPIGLELVEHYLNSGREMCIIEGCNKIGLSVSPSERFLLTSKLKKASNVQIETLAKVIEINKNGVKAVRQDGSEFFFEADSVAVTIGVNPNMDLAKELEGKVPVLKVIGDCRVPARMADATKEGYLAAKEL